MTDVRPAASRRQFVLGGLMGAGGVVLSASRLDALPTAAPRSDEWFDRLRGTEHYLFDSPEPRDGRMLALMRHYYDTCRDDYGLSERDVTAVGTFYSRTTFHGLDDPMWERYQLDSFQEPRIDGSGNPWRRAPMISGRSEPSASIESLQQRGAVFLLCRAALRTRAGQVAERRGADPEAVYADMAGHLVPGVILIPSVIVAIQRAQRRGVAYYQVP